MEGEKNMEQEKTFEQISGENMNLWLKLLKEKNIEAMKELYTEPCSFLPTYSNEIITTREGVGKYFEHFMAKDPEGMLVSEETGEMLADGVYLSAMKYDFNTPKGKVNARYDMVWVRENGRWLIRSHHSSSLPKPEGH